MYTYGVGEVDFDFFRMERRRRWAGALSSKLWAYAYLSNNQGRKIRPGSFMMLLWKLILSIGLLNDAKP